MALTCYTPYVSGLTKAARAVAEFLAAEGQRARVVTTRHDKSLPKSEVRNGVRIIRTPVVARLGKGTISPRFVPTVRRIAARARVLNLHLPMLEAGAIAVACRHPALVTTYQCDVALVPGPTEKLQRMIIDKSTTWAMTRSAAVCVSSDDYARSSRLWDFMADRLEIAPPTAQRPAGVATGTTPVSPGGALSVPCVRR